MPSRSCPSDVLPSQVKKKPRSTDKTKKKLRSTDKTKKNHVKSTNKGKNLSVWFREDEKSEVEAYAEKALEKPGPLARRVVLLYVRGQLVPRAS